LNRRRGSVQRSKLGGIPKWGRWELGAQSSPKDQPACFVCFYDYFVVVLFAFVVLDLGSSVLRQKIG